MKIQMAEHDYGSRPAKQDETVSLDDQVEEIEEDDAFYMPKQRSSLINRRNIPLTTAEEQTRVRTMMRVTRHTEPPVTPRASLKAQQPQPQAKRKPVKKPTSKRKHWLFYCGCGMFASMALWLVGSAALSWLQTQHDNSVYGYPRMYQTDVNVGHTGISHFICENLNGDIVILEIHPSDLATTKVYQGPVFSGPGTDDYVATLEFKDLGNGKPDMIISVNNQRYVLINDGTGFRPVTASDHVDQQEVQ